MQTFEHALARWRHQTTPFGKTQPTATRPILGNNTKIIHTENDSYHLHVYECLHSTFCQKKNLRSIKGQQQHKAHSSLNRHNNVTPSSPPPHSPSSHPSLLLYNSFLLNHCSHCHSSVSFLLLLKCQIEPSSRFV